MRVVVHHPARQEEDGTEVPESTAAFRVGRITDHTDILTGETTPAAKVAEVLLEQARAEFPDCECSIEYLHAVERDPTTNEIIAAEWKDAPAEDAPPSGAVHEQVLNADQGQEVS